MSVPRDRLIKRQDALPLWQYSGSTYHVEFACRPNELSDQEKELVRTVVLRGDGHFFDLAVGCVMPDHVHLMLRSLEEAANQSFDLARIM